MFLTRDPVEGVMARVASRNGYGYVEGNPVNWTDPSGMCIFETLACMGALAVPVDGPVLDAVACTAAYSCFAALVAAGGVASEYIRDAVDDVYIPERVDDIELSPYVGECWQLELKPELQLAPEPPKRNSDQEKFPVPPLEPRRESGPTQTVEPTAAATPVFTATPTATATPASCTHSPYARCPRTEDKLFHIFGLKHHNWGRLGISDTENVEEGIRIVEEIGNDPSRFVRSEITNKQPGIKCYYSGLIRSQTVDVVVYEIAGRTRVISDGWVR